MSGQYAKGTEVPADRSRAEIERTVVRFGGSEFAYATSQATAMVAFSVEDRQVRFVLDFPDPSSTEFTRTPTGKPRATTAARAEWEKACRESWRALALVIKAKLAAIEAGITTFEQEFLANIVLPGGQTIYANIREDLTQALVGNPPSTLLALERS